MGLCSWGILSQATGWIMGAAWALSSGSGSLRGETASVVFIQIPVSKREQKKKATMPAASPQNSAGKASTTPSIVTSRYRDVGRRFFSGAGGSVIRGVEAELAR